MILTPSTIISIFVYEFYWKQEEKYLSTLDASKTMSNSYPTSLPWCNV